MALPRSRATVNNRAMNGGVTPLARTSTKGEVWAGVGNEATEEPHGPHTIYTRSGMLEVSLDCGQHVRDFPQDDVFGGVIDTTCDLKHQNRATK
jgi:hypothetical protein